MFSGRKKKLAQTRRRRRKEQDTSGFTKWNNKGTGGTLEDKGREMYS